MARIYLNELLYKYQTAKTEKQKNKIFDKFIKEIWTSKCEYEVRIKNYKFKINEKLLDNQELIDFFSKYNNIKYKICKSKFSKKDLDSIDYIRIHINNTYSYLFDKEVYYNKEYYKLLYTPKQEYFKIIKNKINTNDINIQELKDKIENNLHKAEKIKQENINKKIDLSWENYKELVNKYLRKCFNNYKSIEEYEEENEWETRVFVDCWNEDNYIISYFNKSLTGYLKNHIRKITCFNTKYKWKHSLNKYLKIEGIKYKYTPLQLCIGRYYKTKEDLLKVSDDNILKLTKKQRQLIMQIKEIIDNHDEKDIILFNEYGIPYVRQAFITEYVKDKYKWNIITMIETIYNRVNSKDKHCIICGNKIISKSNKTKYCPTCWKEYRRKYKTEKQREYRKN